MGKKNVLIAILASCLAFSVLPSVYALQQGEGYILIFFSDMGFDQPLLLTTYDEDVELTATGSFQKVVSCLPPIAEERKMMWVN